MAEYAGEVGDILDAVQQTPIEGLRRVVAEHGARLLLYEPRGLLAIRGNSCDPNFIPTVLFLQPDRASALAELGVRGLESFLAQTAVDEPHTE